MKYALLAIIAISLTVGIYFWTRPRPEYAQPSDCSATVTTTNECIEGVTIK